jgi:hypothetical protein
MTFRRGWRCRLGDSVICCEGPVTYGRFPAARGGRGETGRFLPLLAHRSAAPSVVQRGPARLLLRCWGTEAAGLSVCCGLLHFGLLHFACSFGLLHFGLLRCSLLDVAACLLASVPSRQVRSKAVETKATENPRGATNQQTGEAARLAVCGSL